MKLLDCYIEGFGKFSRQSFSFTEKEQYCEENGWGKSTLAAFLRVMLYGFAGERRQDELSNERKRYAPWQGGGYGGELSFQVQGKSYRLSRSFGINQGKDVFELRDGATNQISHDFSEHIGEEIFQIDAQSFARTLFIAQNDAKSMETTPLIQAKLGKISESVADLGDYDSAMDKLTKKLAELNGRSVTAVLPALKQQMTALTEEIKQGAELDRREEELLQAQAEQKKWRARLRQEMEGRQLTAAEAARLQKYDKIFTKGWPTEQELMEQIKNWQQKLAIEQKQQSNQAAAQELERQIERLRKQRKIANFCLLIAGTLLAITLGLLLWQPVAAIVLAVVAGGLLLFGIFQKSRCQVNKQEQEYRQRKERAEIEKQAAIVVEKAAMDFFAGYGMPYQAEKMPLLLYEWEQYRREYDALCGKRQAVEGVPVPANVRAQEQKTGVADGLSSFLSAAETMDDTLSEIDRQLLAIQAQREMILAAESKLMEVQTDYAAAQKKWDTLQKTKQFLEQARSLFTQKYSAPLLEAYKEYYQRLTGQAAEDYFLDADLHLTLREVGLQREISFFSTGRQDLIGFCMRLALVKVMYPHEKPFLVLDDPFVNWDQAGMEKGLRFLQEIRNEYQILYFTCHPGRALPAK